MHRTEGAGATADNKFTNGNPSTGVAATEVDDNWLNAVQEELIAVLTAAGIEPQTAATETSDQLLAAISALRTAAFAGSNQALASNGYQKLPGGLILQWGNGVTSAGSVTATLPITFPNAALIAVCASSTGVLPTSYVALSPPTTTTIKLWAAARSDGSGTSGAGVQFITIGY